MIKITSCSLLGIKPILERFAETIKSVLDVEVTIVTNNFKRIVSTTDDKLSNQIDENSVFAYAIKSGESFIIEDPRTHKACKACKNRNMCVEHAQVCAPIKINNEVIGVIGLFAESPEQKSRLVDKKENLLNFLSNISDLIAIKCIDTYKTDKINQFAQELDTIINTFDRSIISTDLEGIIQRQNETASNYFGLKIGMDINNIINTKADAKRELNKNYFFEYNDKSFRGIYNKYPIKTEDTTEGYVYTFEEYKSVLGLYNNLFDTNLDFHFEDIIGDSEELTKSKNIAKKASKSSATVLITGESGTGKELFARAVHNNSHRKEYAFIPINCAAIPDNLLESELFGYVEGAFTGSKKGGKMGKFELANNGTLFLDEIGDMPLHLQSKLLRVLQDGCVERIGSNKITKVNVRVICATNKNLYQMALAGEFREDLYYRINVIPIEIPALRQRTNDVPVLIKYFLTKLGMKTNGEVKKITPEAINVLMGYNYKGNVRELENIIEYSINISSDSIIGIDDLPQRVKDDEVLTDTLRNLKDIELEEISKAIRIYGTSKDSVQLIINKLGISRATFYRRLKEIN